MKGSFPVLRKTECFRTDFLLWFPGMKAGRQWCVSVSEREQDRWSRDLVSVFPGYEFYEKHGLGVLLMQGQEILSGASSYTAYNGGIEIEIDTREDCRRRGFAYICGAKLILECLKRGLYPSWDAQNKWSVALAEKLGYHFDHAYQAFEVGPL